MDTLLDLPIPVVSPLHCQVFIHILLLLLLLLPSYNKSSVSIPPDY